MKKLIFVVLLVALLLSLTLTVVLAGMGEDDPCPPGWENNGKTRCFAEPPPGLQNNHHGNAGENWHVPPTPEP